MESRISIITLGVSNFERSLEFYRSLGFPLSEASQGDIAFFKMGGIVLALYPKNELAKDATVDPKGSGFPNFTLAHNVRSKEEADSVLKFVESKGGKIIKPAQDVFWGGYSGYFADPDGFLWEVAWNPFVSFTEDGRLELP
ncbi:VOC family protein [Leptospira sarikeiensis]|uniref:VOC family protein n=1 Tax=Leptospira sarikeiensis TaxID=2484943 RepID=A0A4R9K4P1_9LEPT|nr:VOC family protein [Leptospira sarikeiensis]TGL60443.1 VOC family protein [Leptospira sarikeiensis]